MRFFNIDQHISGMMDVKSIFPSFDQHVTDVCMSGHASLIGRTGESVPELAGDNWCGIITGGKHDFLFDHYYSSLLNFDAFITFYPPVFSLLYKKFERPIIVYMPIRYEYGIDFDAALWEKFNEFLRQPNVILVANNLYDKTYAEGFIEKEVYYIPNLCDYTQAMYNPINSCFAYYASCQLNTPENMIRKYDALKFGHTWQELFNFKGIVHFPYQVSTMSTFEQYTANVPLFFPTKRYLLELMFDGKFPFMNQTSWNEVFKRPPCSIIKHNFDFDPNNYADKDSVEYWLQYADFYNEEYFPFITYFDSFDDLAEISNFSEEKLDEISGSMEMANRRKKEYIFSQWAVVLQKVKEILWRPK